jgi:hypothetical protein
MCSQEQTGLVNVAISRLHSKEEMEVLISSPITRLDWQMVVPTIQPPWVEFAQLVTGVSTPGKMVLSGTSSSKSALFKRKIYCGRRQPWIDPGSKGLWSQQTVEVDVGWYGGDGHVGILAWPQARVISCSRLWMSSKPSLSCVRGPERIGSQREMHKGAR